MFKRSVNRAITLGLCLASGVAISSATWASEPIFKVPANNSTATKSKTFAIDEKLGRAWVEIDFYYAMSETSDHYRVAVPGLRYDPTQSQVIFENDGQRVICANVVRKGWGPFKHQQLQPTGACELSHRYIKKPIDNGFRIEHVEQFEVHFKPTASNA